MSNTQEFITGDIWKIANKRMSEKGKEAAIAYVTSSQLKLTKGDTLICNASDYAIKNGQTDAKVLKHYFDIGVNIFSNRFIHSKILLTNKTIIVGSANLSKSSAEKLTEAAIISHDKTIISGAKTFIFDIIEDTVITKNLKNADIEKLLKIPVLRKPYNPIGKSKTREEKFGSSYWIIRTEESNEGDSNHILNVKKYLSKQYNLKLKNIGDMPWKGESRFSNTAIKGDQFLNIYQKGENSNYIIPFSPILKIEKEENVTRFYYDTSNDDGKISWTRFSQRINALNLSRKVYKNRIRKLSKNDAEKIMTLFN